MDTARPFTVTTQFVTEDTTDTRRVAGPIEHPKYTVNDDNKHDCISDEFLLF